MIDINDIKPEKTVGYKMIKMNEETQVEGFSENDYEVFSETICEIISNVRPLANKYNVLTSRNKREAAISILSQVHNVIIKMGWKYDVSSSLFNYLSEKKLNCVGFTSIYLSVAQILQLPMYPTNAPFHVFAIWELSPNEQVYWETTSGRESSISDLLIRYHIDQSSVSQKIYLTKIPIDSFIASYYINKASYYYSIITTDSKVAYNAELALEIRKDDPLAYINLCNANLEKYDYNDALNNADFAIGLDSVRPSFYITRALIYNKIGNPERSENDIKKAIKLPGAGVEEYQRSINILYKLGKYELAMDYVEKIKELDGNYSSSSFSLLQAKIFNKLNDTEKAIHYCVESISMNYDINDGIVLLDEIIKNNDSGIIKIELLKSGETHTCNPIVYYYLASCSKEATEKVYYLKRAEKVFQATKGEALDFGHLKYKCLDELLAHYKLAEDYDRAIDYCNKLIEAKSWFHTDKIAALIDKIDLLRKSNRKEEAGLILAQCINGVLAPFNKKKIKHRDMAKLYVASKQYELAIDEYKLAISGGSDSLRIDLGDIYVKIGKCDLAIKEYTSVIKSKYVYLSKRRENFDDSNTIIAKIAINELDSFKSISKVYNKILKIDEGLRALTSTLQDSLLIDGNINDSILETIKTNYSEYFAVEALKAAIDSGCETNLSQSYKCISELLNRLGMVKIGSIYYEKYKELTSHSSDFIDTAKVLADIDKSILDGNIDEAVNLYGMLIENDSNNFLYYLERSRLQYMNKRGEMAINDAQMAIILMPDYAFNEYDFNYVHKNRYQRLTESFMILIGSLKVGKKIDLLSDLLGACSNDNGRNKSKIAFLLFKRASLYEKYDYNQLACNDMQRLIIDYELYTSRMINLRDYFDTLKLPLLQINDHEKTVATYTEIIDALMLKRNIDNEDLHIDLKISEAHKYLADEFFRVKKYYQSIDEYKKAYEIVKDNAILLQIAEIYKYIGELDNAYSAYSNYEKNRPKGESDHGLGLLFKFELLAEQGKMCEAYDQAKTIIRKRKHDCDFIRYDIFLLSNHDDRSEILKIAKMDSDILLKGLGFMISAEIEWMENKDYNKAEEQYKLAGQYLKNDMMFYDSIINYYFNTLKHDKAEKYCRIALDNDPDSSDKYEILSSIYEQRNEYDKAIDILTKGIEMSAYSVSPHLYFKRGMLYIKKRSMENVKNDFTKALQIYFSYSSVILSSISYGIMGEIYEQTGNQAHAKKYKKLANLLS